MNQRGGPAASMRFHFQSPALLLAAAIILALAATSVTIGLAALQPALAGPRTTRAGALPVIDDRGADRLIVGLFRRQSADIVEVADRTALEAMARADPDRGIVFEPEDFVEDPDMLPGDEASDRFYQRQGLIS